MINKPIQEIMKNWTFTNKPLVSICCVAYNHEKFIGEALDSFLIQETDFPFEILIHDDASTDSTAEIIQLYETKYPSLVKPIYQTENQYSKGIKIHPTFNFSRAKGKYIALCEGDDFWTDKEKLQYQIKKMKENHNCQISFHPSKLLNDHTMTDKILSKHEDSDKIFTIQDIIKGDGGFCPTASIIMTKEVIVNLPAFFSDAPVGDYFLQILGSINGGALYIDKTMSAYRIHPGGVWTSITKDFSLRKKFLSKMLYTMDEMNEFYNFQYNEEIAFIKSNQLSIILKNKKNPIQDRIDLFQIHKHHLSNSSLIQWFLQSEKEASRNLETQRLLIEEKLAHLQNKYEFDTKIIQNQLRDANNQLSKAKNKYNNLINSKSWKLTSPLRKIRERLKFRVNPN